MGIIIMNKQTANGKENIIGIHRILTLKLETRGTRQKKMNMFESSTSCSGMLKDAAQ